MLKPKKTLIGMSGGVDSAAAALLLKQQGHTVAGATFKLFGGQNEKDLADAKRVCDALCIPHHIFDFTEIFRKTVMDDFAREYSRGATPNPCVVCNRSVKFGAFLEKARSLGFDYISTGHYASVVYDEEKRRYRVRKAAHIKKDQSYVLYSLTQEQLAAVLLPLGGYDKPQVREIAEKSGLPVSRKSESQDICFIPCGDYAAFLHEYLQSEPIPGPFIDVHGDILGEHKGIWHYTIGQRKGIRLSFPQPMFVSGIDSAKNTVTLAEERELFKTVLIASRLNWIDFDALASPARFDAKIRYGATPAPAIVTPLQNGDVRVVFDAPQRAITKGQSVVFYDGDYVAGGGVICGTE